MPNPREFEAIKSDVFTAIGNDQNNLQERSISLLIELTSLVSKDTSSKGEPEALIDLLVKHIELERDDWKRVRTAIEHENNLTNYRINWLLVSQTFLVNAFVLCLNQWVKPETGSDKEAIANLYPLLLVVITITGMIVCLLTYIQLIHGQHQLGKLDNWWHVGKDWNTGVNVNNYKDVIKNKVNQGRIDVSKSHPPLQGSKYLRYDVFLKINTMPIYMLILWLSLFIFTLLYRFVIFCVYSHAILLAFASILFSTGITLLMVNHLNKDLVKVKTTSQ